MKKRQKKQQQGAPSVLMAILVMAVGCLPLLIGLGVIKPQGAVHAPLFIVGAIGVAFIMSGVMILSQALGLPQKSPLSKALAFVLLCSFLSPFVWLSFLGDGPIIFRIAFGIPVVMVILVFLLPFIPGVKVISAEEAAQRQVERISRKL
ncbi:MAG: hypothetical protein JST01_21930 [Cyanobacteria bacterium SZAS TMP-1]|nr:hypothetical protein [Cyanobacteria bacterium SZAS TMP-1]